MKSAITTPYDPDDCVGTFGWLWMGEEPDGDWTLVVTFDDDGTLAVTGWSMDDAYADTTPQYDADLFRGYPYLPLSAPACDPGAGLLVTIHLPSGASLSFSKEDPGPEADATRQRVIEALELGHAGTAAAR